MSAFGGKADMTGYGCLLSRSLLGVKRTCVAALMSLLLTQSGHFTHLPERVLKLLLSIFVFEPKYETARIPPFSCLHDNGVRCAAWRARPTENAGDRLPKWTIVGQFY